MTLTRPRKAHPCLILSGSADHHHHRAEALKPVHMPALETDKEFSPYNPRGKLYGFNLFT